MAEKERDITILDLGIGTGGDYLKKDPPSTLRIGVDKEGSTLWVLKTKAGLPLIPLVLENAYEIYERQGSFPFKDGVFDKIEIYFPLDELLHLLVDDSRVLWKEMGRVLKEKGEIKIIIDIPFFQTTGYFVKDEPREIDYPHQKITANAESSGFSVRKWGLFSDELKDIGTNFSIIFAKRMENEIFKPNVVEITAKKT